MLTIPPSIRLAFNRPDIIAFIQRHHGMIPADATAFSIGEVEFSLDDFNTIAQEIGWLNGERKINPAALTGIPEALSRATFDCRQISGSLSPDVWLSLYSNSRGQPHILLTAQDQAEAQQSMYDAIQNAGDSLLSFFHPDWRIDDEIALILRDYAACQAVDASRGITMWLLVSFLLSTRTFEATELTPLKGEPSDLPFLMECPTHAPYMVIDDTLHDALRTHASTYYRTPGGLVVRLGDTTAFDAQHHRALFPVDNKTVERLIAANES